MHNYAACFPGDMDPPEEFIVSSIADANCATPVEISPYLKEECGMGAFDFVLLQKLSQQRRDFLELLGVAYVTYELLQRQSNLIWPGICDRDALGVRALTGKSMACSW